MLTIKDSFPDLIIPGYFLLRESADEWRLCHRDYEGEIDSIFEGKYTALGTSEGRGSHDLVRIKSVSGKEDDAIVRTYKRGGLSGLFLPDIFSDARRPLEELVVTEQGRSDGVALPEILGLQIKWLTPFFYRAKIIVKIIPQSVTLDESVVILSSEKDRRKLYRSKKALINSIAFALKRFHNAGICHRDLNVRNVLVRVAREDADFKAYIIDLDKAVYSPEPARLSLDERAGNLIRLNRSLDKLFFKKRLAIKGAVSRTDRLRFFYSCLSDTELSKSQKRIFIIRCLRESGLHKWWWKLISPGTNH